MDGIALKRMGAALSVHKPKKWLGVFNFDEIALQDLLIPLHKLNLTIVCYYYEHQVYSPRNK